MKDTQTKQIKVRSTIRLPLDEFESIDLSLCLPIAVLRRQGSTNSIVVAIDAGSKATQLRNTTLLGLLQPSGQHFHLPMDDHRTKILRELIGSCQDFILDA